MFSSYEKLENGGLAPKRRVTSFDEAAFPVSEKLTFHPPGTCKGVHDDEARSRSRARDPARAFDFWKGSWRVETGGQLAGHNDISLVAGDCVLLERWTGASGGRGASLNAWDPSERKWKQSWVWSWGARLDLAGGIRDGRMVMEGDSKAANGAVVKNRITWSREGEGRVRQFWETSSDGGKTWASAFDGLYIPEPAAK